MGYLPPPAFINGDSPLRASRRGLNGRSGANAGPFRRVFGASVPAVAARYLLYAVLLLIGYLAGTSVRPLSQSFAVHLDTPPRPASASTKAGLSDGAEAPTHSPSRGGAGAAGTMSYDAGRRQTLGTVSSISASSPSPLSKSAQETGSSGPSVSLPSSGSPGWGPQWEAAQAPATNRTLRFQVCNGFANQRLGVLYGMLLARRLGRAAVVPVLVGNGLQRSDANVLAGTDNQTPFADVYDMPYFISAMARVGVSVVRPEDAPPLSKYTQVALSEYGWSVATPLADKYGSTAHLAVDCTLFKMMPGDLLPDDTEIMWAVLEGLRPNAQTLEMVERVIDAIPRAALAVAAREAAAAAASSASSSSPSSAAAARSRLVRPEGFNFIHLRIENDWIEHCRRWEALQDGVVRDNCYAFTDDIGTRLALFGLPNSTALYVGSYWEDVDNDRRDKALAQLAAAGYTVIASRDVSPTAGHQHPLGRECAAMVEYFVGMRAERFIGNSVSTFAALALLERRRRGQWAAYYNGGNIPLASMLPQLHRLPWVFTYNSWSPSYEYMLKGAVRSAQATRSLHPYCIFTGNISSPVAQWLQRHNVTLISHEPAWRQQLVAKARSRAKENVHHSHLFKTPDMLVSTFQRVDLPVVPVLDQYTYVLYTDADVYFRKPIKLDDFGLPLPRSISMSYEFVNSFPYNAGVIVANLPAMRQRYAAFIAMMLDNDNGLYYTNYGPADQGILNKFYEQDLKAQMLSQAFNTKPYNAFDDNAFIVHFHGPKPHDLLAFLANGHCDFFTVCETGLLNSVCQYAREWVEWVPDHLVSLRLEDACTWLQNPTAAEVFKKKWGLEGTLQASASSATISADMAEQLAQADHLHAAYTRAYAASDEAASPEDASSVPSVPSPSLPAEELKRVKRMWRALRQHRGLQQDDSLGRGAAERRPGHRHRRRAAVQLDEHQREQGRGADAERPAGANNGGAASVAVNSSDGNLSGGDRSTGGGGPSKALKEFDTFQAVTVDEAALEEAWDTAEEGSREGD